MTVMDGHVCYAGHMRDFDPNDSRPPYQQLADVLTAAIESGEYKPGDKLPSGAELAQRYGLSRQTVQSTMRLLRQNRAVVSRQGQGVYVRTPATMTSGTSAFTAESYIATVLDDANTVLDKMCSTTKSTPDQLATYAGWLNAKFTAAALLEILRRLDPDQADAVTRWLNGTLEDGQVVAELVWQWREQIDLGEPMTDVGTSATVVKETG